MLGILVSGGVSGGHLNPAITVAMASIGKFPWRKVGDIVFEYETLEGQNKSNFRIFAFS